MNKNKLYQEVEDNGGLHKMTLGALRGQLGYERLGRYVLSEIQDALSRANLGHFPPKVLDPDRNAAPRQWHEVWVYTRDGGARARVLDAVLNPDAHDVELALSSLSEHEDTTLTADQKLDRIRQLVS